MCLPADHSSICQFESKSACDTVTATIAFELARALDMSREFDSASTRDFVEVQGRSDADARRSSVAGLIEFEAECAANSEARPWESPVGSPSEHLQQFEP